MSLATVATLGADLTAWSAEKDVADGQRLMSQAATELTAIPCLVAKFRQKVQLFGQELTGSGRYLQKQSPRGLLLRLEIKLQVGDQLSSLLQVCDGRFLWIRRDLPGGASLGRVDMQRIRTAIQEGGSPPWADVTTNWLALGGLPWLVTALADNFEFSTPQAVRSDTLAMWVVDGRWRLDKLGQLDPDLKGDTLASQPIDLTRLPAQLPTDVRVVLGQADRFPYRIEYRRLGSNAADGSTTPHPMVVLEMVEFQRREDLDEALFTYQPGNQEIADFTPLYLRSLKLGPQGKPKPE